MLVSWYLHQLWGLIFHQHKINVDFLLLSLIHFLKFKWSIGIILKPIVKKNRCYNSGYIDQQNVGQCVLTLVTQWFTKLSMHFQTINTIVKMNNAYKPVYKWNKLKINGI